MPEIQPDCHLVVAVECCATTTSTNHNKRPPRKAPFFSTNTLAALHRLPKLAATMRPKTNECSHLIKTTDNNPGTLQRLIRTKGIIAHLNNHFACGPSRSIYQLKVRKRLVQLFPTLRLSQRASQANLVLSQIDRSALAAALFPTLKCPANSLSTIFCHQTYDWFHPLIVVRTVYRVSLGFYSLAPPLYTRSLQELLPLSSRCWIHNSFLALCQSRQQSHRRSEQDGRNERSGERWR